MIKITLQIDNKIQRDTVEITDNEDNIDVTFDQFLELFQRAMSGLGFANYELKATDKEEE